MNTWTSVTEYVFNQDGPFWEIGYLFGNYIGVIRCRGKIAKLHPIWCVIVYGIRLEMVSSVSYSPSLFIYRTRSCNPFMEPRKRFSAWRNRFLGIDSGLIKRLKIWALSSWVIPECLGTIKPVCNRTYAYLLFYRFIWRLWLSAD